MKSSLILSFLLIISSTAIADRAIMRSSGVLKDPNELKLSLSRDFEQGPYYGQNDAQQPCKVVIKEASSGMVVEVQHPSFSSNRNFNLSDLNQFEQEIENLGGTLLNRITVTLNDGTILSFMVLDIYPEEKIITVKSGVNDGVVCRYLRKGRN